jgi:DNA-binding PadR family transcriptional regulator
MSTTGAAGEAFPDPATRLRMVMAAWADREEEHVEPWGGGRPGPRGRFPFGRFGRPGFGRGKKRSRVPHGDIRAAVLVLLSGEPMHGYQIIQEIEEHSGGLWQPSPGSIYPILQQLEDEGLIRIEQNEGRKVAHLTEAGHTYVEDNRAKLEAAWKAVTRDVDERAVAVRSLFALLQQIATASKELARVGTESQLAEAKKLLADTRRRLYLILAEVDTDNVNDTGDINDI